MLVVFSIDELEEFVNNAKLSDVSFLVEGGEFDSVNFG